VSPEQQFWWNWWVNLAVAVATFLAAMVALFGRQFWTLVSPPLLKMKLLEEYGEKTIAVRQIKENLSMDDEVRFFHLTVRNERRRWATAHQVQVFLVGIEQPGPSGEWQVTWTGNVPMRWRDQEITPFTQTIGAPVDCDFCMVGKFEPVLSLMPLLAPNNLKVHWQGPCKFMTRLQARSTEKDSDELYIQVAWDGKWEDGDIEMKKHLTVEIKRAVS
jgi:hypothetical protein